MPAAPTRVLVVDDNPADARLAEYALTHASEGAFAVDRASRVAEALRKLAEQRFDAILLDLGLPDSEGLEGLERVRRAAPRTPVFILSGREDLDLRERAVAAGALGTLVKGRYDPATLARRLGAIQSRGAGPEDPGPRPAGAGPSAALDAIVWEGLRQLGQGDPGFLGTFVATYLEEGDRLVARITDAIAQGQSLTVERSSHALKSSSAQVGATEVRDLAERLEVLGHAGDLPGARNAGAALGPAWSRLRPVLESAAQAG